MKTFVKEHSKLIKNMKKQGLDDDDILWFMEIATRLVLITEEEKSVDFAQELQKALESKMKGV